MFTPDTFYQTLQNCFFNDPKDLVYGPVFHGQKDLLHYVPRVPPDQHAFYKSTIDQKMAYNTVWLYDQEPIFPHVADILRQSIMDQCDPEQQADVQQLTFAQILALWRPSTSFPIWCTSDRTGVEIDQLIDAHFIICDYWYHAFIARDWYRQFQYWPSFTVYNKHAADYRMIMYCRDDQGTRVYRKTVKLQMAAFQRQILHDWNGHGQAQSDLSAVIDCDDARRSGVHLVLETLFDSDKKYLTEKVFKPIVMSQAFIVWGPPGTLAYLREHGFRTFDHVWSEDYDKETDPVRRMHLLQHVVQHISGLSDSEYKNLYEKCLPMIQHNRDWFYSDRFMDLCWSNLQNNSYQAIEQRAAMLLDRPGGQLFALLDKRPELLNQPLRRSIAKNHLRSLDQNQLNLIIKKYPALNAL